MDKWDLYTRLNDLFAPMDCNQQVGAREQIELFGYADTGRMWLRASGLDGAGESAGAEESGYAVVKSIMGAYC